MKQIKSHGGYVNNRIIALILIVMLSLSTVVSAAIFDMPVVNKSAVQEIAFYTVKGNEFEFSCDNIESRLGVPRGTLLGMTITSLPESSKAKFSIGDDILNEFDTLTRDDINSLKLSTVKDVEKIEIGFIPDCTQSIATIATISILDTYNNPPKVESGTYNTNRNIPVMGKITAYDPDGDMVRIKVISKPEKGTITFNGLSFEYKPYAKSVGKDRFTFICEDKYGNISNESFVDVMIEDIKSSISYADMNGNPSHYAAIKLSQKSILTGRRIGGQYFLEPNVEVSRGEFLLMLISAAMLEKELPPCVNTGLQNDSEIPLYLKPYVKLGIDKGIIKENKFNFKEIPTRAEAVVMVSRTAGMPNVTKHNPNISDIVQIPEWALSSYMNLSAYKMLDLHDGKAHPNNALTRAGAVDLIWQLWKYADTVR
ncbi:MAG: hypothetical protein GX988_01610 [Clostridiales bacterium]|nr:hypothetical protein [Clostridiales bacterium]